MQAEIQCARCGDYGVHYESVRDAEGNWIGGSLVSCALCHGGCVVGIPALSAARPTSGEG